MSLQPTNLLNVTRYRLSVLGRFMILVSKYKDIKEEVNLFGFDKKARIRKALYKTIPAALQEFMIDEKEREIAMEFGLAEVHKDLDAFYKKCHSDQAIIAELGTEYPRGPREKHCDHIDRLLGIKLNNKIKSTK